MMKKTTLISIIFILFYLSYSFKNLPIFMLAISLTTLLGFFIKKFNKNFLISIFSILITLSLFESFLFFFLNDKSIKIDNINNFTSDIKYEKTFLGYQPKPGIHNYKIVTDGKVEIDKYYSIGKNKFRITPKINDFSKIRTLNFFGGSFAFGFGLNDDETMAFLIQKYFKEWKVNNYGVNGYGVHQMLAHIQKNPEILGDINILMTVEGHVPSATCKRHSSFGTPKFVINYKKELVRSGNCQFGVLDKIPIPKIFGSIINRSEIKNIIFNIFNSENTFYNSKAIEIYLSIVSEINQITSDNNKTLIVGYMDSSTDLNRRIIDSLLQKNIQLIDLSLDKNNESYWLPDKHTSKAGNEKRVLIMQKKINEKFIK